MTQSTIRRQVYQYAVYSPRSVMYIAQEKLKTKHQEKRTKGIWDI